MPIKRTKCYKYLDMLVVDDNHVGHNKLMLLARCDNKIHITHSILIGDMKKFFGDFAKNFKEIYKYDIYYDIIPKCDNPTVLEYLLM